MRDKLALEDQKPPAVPDLQPITYRLLALERTNQNLPAVPDYQSLVCFEAGKPKPPAIGQYPNTIQSKTLPAHTKEVTKTI